MIHQPGFRTFKVCLAVCTSLLISDAPVAWAGAPALVGKISVKGSAEVNGIGSVTGKNVFSGDRIVTDQHSTASVTSRYGSRFLVIGSSAVQINDAGGSLTAVLDRGGVAAVSPAKAPLIVEVRGIRINPAATGSVYAVVLDGNNLKVLAQSGRVSVEAADRTVVVEEGKALDATTAPAQASGGGAAAGGSHLTTVLIITAAALAASTIALAVVTARTGCTVSPSAVGTCQVTH